MSEQAPSYESAFPLLPLRGNVLFPSTVMPYEIGRPKTIALAEHVAKENVAFVVAVTQRDAKVDDPGVADLYEVGTLARVIAVERLKTGSIAIVVQGVRRVRLRAVESTSPFLQAWVDPFGSVHGESDDELVALGLSLREASAKVIELMPGLTREAVAQAQQLEAPGDLADFVASHLDISVPEKIELLDLSDPKVRVRKLLELVARRAEVLKLRDEINSHVKSDFDKSQREYVLRQQMKAIQQELGEGDEDKELDGLDELQKRIEDAALSPEAARVAAKELKRLRAMSPQSPEGAMVRSYLEWIVDLPWTASVTEEPDIKSVRAVLDRDHYGLEKVKRRIVEYLAVRKLKSSIKDGPAAGTATKGPILCLIGPPGVGKTSLGKSIASALGREFVRVSLGGVHDEAQIRGHRRTYVGALPGQIIQGMKKAKTTSPVFMLDEIDKLGSDFRGDPSSALLEVLDPEQNGTFADHYLEIPYDLSKIVFVATANVGDTIPAPLRDRMEIIEIAGYTRSEKLAIARRHLVPKQLAEHGLSTEHVQITDGALETLVEQYTREAGVRSLERQIAAVIRGVVVQAAEVGASEDKSNPVVVETEEDLRKILGPAKFTNEVIDRTEDPGVATGLAWTPVGGSILFVEATKMPGKGRLTLTGQLGDVMKESAQTALSYVRANANRFGIEPRFIDGSDLHIHVPAGAMPKDGPSAGITLATALVSLLTAIRVRHDVAMTGEITLRGRVLPIGGLKEKVLAAHRAGIKRVIVPERNRADLDEIPQEVKRDLEFVFVARAEQVIEAALEEKPWARLWPQGAPRAAA
jgi:ATP-dependent Lon protease